MSRRLSIRESLTGEVAHRANCRCGKAARTKPAVMEDERTWVFDLLAVQILDVLDKKLRDYGAEPIVRTYSTRYNSAGEPIGPDVKIRRCDALLFWDVFDDVLEAVGKRAKKGVNTVDILSS